MNDGALSNRKKEYTYGFVERLYACFQRSGLTGAELARMIGVERKSVYAYMNGDTAPDVLRLARLCAVLRVSPEYLLFGHERPRFNDPERTEYDGYVY